MDNFYVLCRILIEKCSFLVSCQFNAKSGAIDQLTIGDRPVDRDRLVGYPWCKRLRSRTANRTAYKPWIAMASRLKSIWRSTQLRRETFMNYFLTLHPLLWNQWWAYRDPSSQKRWPLKVSWKFLARKIVLGLKGNRTSPAAAKSCKNVCTGGDFAELGAIFFQWFFPKYEWKSRQSVKKTCTLQL